MFRQHENEIRYKWDPQTHSGYKLRFDAEGAAQGAGCCYHVEDWACRTVVDEWPCANLDEALRVLNHFFTVDIGAERERLRTQWPVERARLSTSEG